MTYERTYSLSEAGRRMGLSPQRAGQMQRDGKLRQVPNSDPVRVFATEVEAARATSLAKYDAVIDATEVESRPADDRSTAELVVPVNAWLRAQASSRDLIDRGLALIREGERVLTDAVVAHLPPDDVPPND